MRNWITIAVMLRGCVVLLGLFFVYAAVFVYEDEQGKLQNMLEDWWVQIEDAKQTVLSKHTAFMRYIADLITSAINRLFGVRLLSLQSLGVSAFYCYASSLLVFCFASAFFWDSESIILIVLFVPFIAGCLVLGSLPVFLSSIVWKIIWATVIGGFLCLWALGLVIVSIAPNPESETESLFGITFRIAFFVGTILGLAISSALSLAFIAFARKLLRWSSGMEHAYQIIGVVLLNLIIVGALVALPVVVFRSLESFMPDDVFESQMSVRHLISLTVLALLVGTATANVLPALVSLSFIVLALLMGAHRIFWPSLARPIYSLQRLGIAKRSKLLGSVGALLIVGSIGGWPWIEKIVEKLIP